jgi:hypothetical protein
MALNFGWEGGVDLAFGRSRRSSSERLLVIGPDRVRMR